eukprot:CAMPEP_0118965690 /NCGR_PEP_ID=MMETSP1173-20130426/3225_1 /TAXON_ID=1034831 /ORGANISM="Rhizochromulina marina cf, Strain CCMP1243" /LENGTH=539 /DNA_ID=CAMNT_0006914349 /DNA_START=197 /DNA_END=1817 /DNA_ORIENTATION=+
MAAPPVPGGAETVAKVLMSFFVAANLINYLDRGIIPGAPSEIDAFITGSNDIGNVKNVDVYLGITQSMFIVGFSLAAIVFGHLVHKYPPFRLVGIGLVVWIISAIAAGLSKYTKSFLMLAAARMVSGVGEASFQVVAAPYIQDNAGEKQGLWLGLFYTAIPFGTCIGYGYGALLAASPAGWPMAFFLEALLMMPLAIFCFLLDDTAHLSREPALEDRLLAADALDYPKEKEDQEGMEEGAEGEKLASSPAVEEHYPVVDTAKQKLTSFEAREDQAEGPTVWEEVLACARRPLFVWSSLGYAGYSGGLIGFSTFGPAFVMALGYFDSEYEASIVFGVSMAIAGLVGTPLGGLLLDWKLRRGREAGRPGFQAAASQSCLANLVGTIIAGVCVWAYPAWLFMGAICVGACFMFLSTSSMNLAVLESVPHDNRPFAVAFSVLIMHAMGDVPSPIVVGALKDQLAPDCTPKDADDDKNDVVIPDGCDHQQHQLRMVLLFIICWLSMSSVAFGIAWALAIKKHRDGTLERHSRADSRSASSVTHH